jgi:hypothetical protein
LVADDIPDPLKPVMIKISGKLFLVDAVSVTAR